MSCRSSYMSPRANHICASLASGSPVWCLKSEADKSYFPERLVVQNSWLVCVLTGPRAKVQCYLSVGLLTNWLEYYFTLAVSLTHTEDDI